MQATVTFLLVVQNMPAPLDVRCMLVYMSLADWQVPSGNLLLHDHCAHKCMGTQPTRSHTNSETLPGFWDINGVEAHCLLDSGCEGVMIFPNFIHTMGIVPIKLEQLIGLQLACMGSKSTINYGAKNP